MLGRGDIAGIAVVVIGSEAIVNLVYQLRFVEW